MDKNKDNLNKDKSWWKPVMIFYVKTTSWIIFPLVLAFLIGNYFSKTPEGQTLFLVCVMAGFGISCFGIYREIKQYKKDLDPPSPKATDGQGKKDGK